MGKAPGKAPPKELPKGASTALRKARLSRAHNIRVTIAAVLGLLSIALWAQALTNPPKGPPLAADYTEASLRWAIAVTSRRVDDFERTYHRVPDALSELGGHPWQVITYERVDLKRYRLIAPGTTSPIIYDSMESLQAFLGRSRELIGAPPPRLVP